MPVYLLHEVDILKESNGQENKDFIGTRGLLRQQRENGHLEVLKWLRANGCPWNEEVCGLAATEGHLEILKWARENGCPIE